MTFIGSPTRARRGDPRRRAASKRSRSRATWSFAKRFVTLFPLPPKVALKLRRARPSPKALRHDRSSQRAARKPRGDPDGLARQDREGARAVRRRPRHGGAGLQRGRRARARPRPDLCVRSRHDAGDLRRLLEEPPGDGPGLSRHRQVDPHRAGRGAAQLADDPHQPRRAHQPHRPRRPRRDRASRRPAGDRVPRRPAAVGAAAPGRSGVRRI